MPYLTLSPRQRLSALYFQLHRKLFRTLGPEFYALDERTDMAGRATVHTAHVAFNMPLDWRAEQRAHQNVLVYLWVAYFLWLDVYQAWLGQRMGLAWSDYWWLLPGGIVPAIWQRTFGQINLFGLLDAAHGPVAPPAIGAAAAAFPLNSLVALVIGLLTISGLHRFIVFAQSMDRTGLSTEHGSTYFAMPEELASDDPEENMYPPGYDIYGGFDEASRRRRVIDLEAIDGFENAVEERKRRAEVEDIELDLPSSPPMPALPAPKKVGLEDDLARLLSGASE